jgi:hypothetical protein
MRRVIAAASLAVLMAKAPFAEERRTIDQVLSDEAVERTLQIALEQLPQAKCGGFSCAAPTEEERAAPPLTITQARLALRAGMLSGSAEVCGLDWQRRVYLPFMEHQRKEQELTERQMALTTVLHAIMQSFVKGDMKNRKESCTHSFRKKIEAQITVTTAPKAAAQ